MAPLLTDLHQLLLATELAHQAHMQNLLFPEMERIKMYEPEELSVALVLEAAAIRLAHTEGLPSWKVALFQVLNERVRCRIALNSVYIGILNSWVGTDFHAHLTSQVFYRPTKLEQLVWVDFAALMCHDCGLTVHYWPETKQVRILTNSREEVYSS